MRVSSRPYLSKLKKTLRLDGPLVTSLYAAGKVAKLPELARPGPLALSAGAILQGWFLSYSSCAAYVLFR